MSSSLECHYIAPYIPQLKAQPKSQILTLKCHVGHLSLLEYLLGLLTIDLDAGNSSLCGTALHAAVRGGHLSIIQRLLNLGAKVAAATAKGSTPLHLAADNGDVAMIK